MNVVTSRRVISRIPESSGGGMVETRIAVVEAIRRPRPRWGSQAVGEVFVLGPHWVHVFEKITDNARFDRILRYYADASGKMIEAPRAAPYPGTSLGCMGVVVALGAIVGALIGALSKEFWAWIVVLSMIGAALHLANIFRYRRGSLYEGYDQDTQARDARRKAASSVS